MINLAEILVQSLMQVWVSFTHNWPFLLASVVISVALRLYIQPDKISALLMRYQRVGVLGATAAAVTTPFCSCGTTAVILGMIASTIPWAPVIAFMVASPLTSPEELIYSAGIFGWPFAIAFFVSSILLGLMGGMVGEFFESRGWLKNQTRFQTASVPVTAPVTAQDSAEPSCACQGARQPAQIRDIRVNRPVLAMAAGPVAASTAGCGCGTAAPSVQPGACGCAGSQETAATDDKGATAKPPAAAAQPVTLRRWMEELYRTGRQLLVMFLGFAFIGYVLNGLIPQEWVAGLFGAGNVYSVPLAATAGLPFYLNTEGSLPLVRALIDGGMSQGAALAFLITGAGTSIGAVAGALTIARWRVIALVVGTLWTGAVLLGFLYDFLLALHLF